MDAAMLSSDRIGRRMKLQDLHVLMTVVETGSMGRAAERLNTCQPAISRSIAGMEHALGVRLLDRRRQGVEPTQYGRALIECGRAVFDDLRLGMRNIEFLANPTAGEVRIGCNPFLAPSFLCAVVDRLSRRFPRIVSHVVPAQMETLQRELSERSIDFVVAPRFGGLADERLAFEPLYEDTHVVATGAHNPWVRRRRIDLAELVNEAWVLPPSESLFGSLARQAFRASGLDYPPVTVCTAPSEVRINLLATGRFLSIFATSALRFPAERPELKVLPVKLAVDPVPVGIVTLKNRTLSPVAQLFMDSARELAKVLVKRRR
jgi:DNA-binding transcriptional LysR family regulator